MKNVLVGVLVLLSGCVTAEATEKKSAPVTSEAPDVAAAARLRAVLDTLPRCAPGAAVGLLAVTPTVCTKMFCGKACCNQCGWAATLETKSGEKQALEAARVSEVLKVPTGALDCEVAAWAQVLSTQSIALDGAACLVR